MAIIVEDGTGLATAESYCTTLFATQYFKQRGMGTTWDSLDIVRKEQLLRQATDYIELRFSARFRGVRSTSTQALSFPRDRNPVLPMNLLRATAEYALRALSGPLVADPTTDASGLQVKSYTKKLGPLEKTFEYDTTSASLFKPYPAADMLLKSLLRPTGLIR